MKKILLGSALIVLSAIPVFAQVSEWDFDAPGNYTFNTSDIQVSDGYASLKGTNFIDDENVPGEFADGIFTNTAYDGTLGGIDMDAGQTSGSFVSRVIDGLQVGKIWTQFDVLQGAVYGYDLPDDGVTETGYDQYNADMSSNALLFHFDESNGSSSFTDSSGNGNTGSCSNCPTSTSGIFGNAFSFDGTNDVVNVQDADSLDLDDGAAMEMWVKHGDTESFTYRRPITISPTPTRDGVQMKLELDSGFSYANLSSADGDDIRFTDEDGYNLPYWIEEWNNGGDSVIWVRTRTRGTTTIYMHYGNASVAAGSNGDDTFLFFDDFDRSQMDGNDWYLAARRNPGNFTLDASELHSRVQDSSNSVYSASSPGYADSYETQRVFDNDDVIVEFPITVNNIGGLSSAYVRLALARKGISGGFDFFGWYPSGNGVLLWPSGSGTQYFNTGDSHVQVGTSRLKVFYGNAEMRAIGSGEAVFDVTRTFASTNTSNFHQLQLYAGGGINSSWDMPWMIVRLFDDATTDGEFAMTVGAESTTNSALAYRAEDFRYERSVLFSPATPENDYQVKVELDSTFPYSNVQEDGSDVRFYTTGGTLLSHWIENWNDENDESLVWVKVPTSGTSSIVMRYGNDAVESGNDGANTFDFFDDFSGSSLDTASTWTILNQTGSSVLEVVGGYLRLYRPTGSIIYIESQATLSGYKVIKAKLFDYEHTTNRAYYTCIAYGDATARSSIGYANFNNAYESAIATTSSPGTICPNRTYDSGSSVGDIITYPNFEADYFDEEFTIPSGFIYRSMDGAAPEVSTTYTGVNSGKIQISAASSQPMTSHFDYIYVRKWNATEPAVTLGPEQKRVQAAIDRDEVLGLSFGGSKAYVSLAGEEVGGFLKNGDFTHMLLSNDGSYNQLYVGGLLQAIAWANVGFPATPTAATQFGGSTNESVYTAFSIDDFALYDVALDATDALYHFMRGTVGLTHQIKICDDDACVGETFEGPDGTGGTTFSHSLPDRGAFVIVDPSTNGQYIQYRSDFSADEDWLTGSIHEVGVGPASVVTTNPTIVNTIAGAVMSTVTGFAHTLGAATQGVVEYQISHNGTNWYYWNGSSWTEQTGAGYSSETNSVSEIDTNIGQYATDVSDGSVYFRAFLNSDGSQPVILDQVALTVTDSGFITSGSVSPSSPNTATTTSLSINPIDPVATGASIVVSIPDSFGGFDSLTSSDVVVTGDNISSTVKSFDTVNRTITIELTITGSQSNAISVVIGDGAGPLNDLTTPTDEGVYSIAFASYNSADELTGQGYALMEINNTVTITAYITEGLVMTLTNSSGGTGITLTVDPGTNGGQDLNSSTTVTVSTNSPSGYSVKARLDDGDGNAALANGNGDQISSNVAAGDNYFGYTARNGGTGSATAAEQDFAATDANLLDDGDAEIGLSEATNSQAHTVNYDLNVNYLTPAGVYSGTIYYTVVASF